MQKIQRIKSNPQEIKIDKSWIASFANLTKINKKNAIKINENGEITIKPHLLRSISQNQNGEKVCRQQKKSLKKMTL